MGGDRIYHRRKPHSRKEHHISYVNEDGAGAADLFYNGEEWFTVSLENYYEGAEEKGIIYNFTIKTDDCSIDGLIPYQTTRQEVIEKYGEPDEILQRSGNYCYGTTNNNSNPLGVIEEQRLTIRFDENDMVALVSITYANLTNEK